MKRIELASRTPAGWAERVVAEPLLLLGDHAHCELQAAAAVAKLAGHAELPREAREALSAMAHEEEEHFRRVQAVLRARGAEVPAHAANPYAQGLLESARRERGDALLARLLVAGLIEARSLERFRLLARAFEAHDAELAALYHGLIASEAGHQALFARLACERAGEERARSRADELAEREAELVARLPFAWRVHSGYRDRTLSAGRPHPLDPAAVYSSSEVSAAAPRP